MKLQIFFFSGVCHCEHKFGGMPNNGIMCGVSGQHFKLEGYCMWNEKCIGPTKNDPISSFAPLEERNGNLCSKGKDVLKRYVLIHYD